MQELTWLYATFVPFWIWAAPGAREILGQDCLSYDSLSPAAYWHKWLDLYCTTYCSPALTCPSNHQTSPGQAPTWGLASWCLDESLGSLPQSLCSGNSPVTRSEAFSASLHCSGPFTWHKGARPDVRISSRMYRPVLNGAQCSSFLY